MAQKNDILAFDAPSSVRHRDDNGYLHVDTSNLTRVQVAPYYGREIPGCTELGLEPDRVYYMLRPADELAKAVSTFNGIPIAMEHHEMDADHLPKQFIVGSTGTDAAFTTPFLTNSLTITDADAIKAIESGEFKELSAAYRYSPVMEGGISDGQHYDGKMTDISANHVALVREGRAGPEVVVADSNTVAATKATPAGKASDKGKGVKVMAEKKPGKKLEKKLNYKGLGLALDAVPAIESAEVSVASLFHAINAVEAQREGIDPRSIGLDIDKDATIDQIVERFLPQASEGDVTAVKGILERLSTAPDTSETGDAAEAEPPADEPEGKKVAAPAAAETTDCGDVKAAAKGCGLDTEDPSVMKAFEIGTKFGAKKGDAPEVKPEQKTADAVDKAAMDAQIEATKTDMKKHFRDLFKAAQDCSNFVKIPDPMAFDSAADIYKKTLTLNGVDVTGVDPSAFPAMVKMLRRGESAKVGMAGDSGISVSSDDKEIADIMKNLSRIDIA